MSAALGTCCPACGETLVEESDLGRCPACYWREFAATD